MGIYLNPRSYGFRESLNSEIYVDKTGMIEHLNKKLHTKQKYVCVSRPRRFGKTMALEMMSAYYCKEENTKELFKNLEIEKSETFEKYLNKYNVILINMINFLTRAKTLEDMLKYLEKVIIKELKEAYPNAVEEDEEQILPVILEKVYNHTGVGFVFLIDEWDCIFREKQNNQEMQRQYLDFLRDLFKDRIYISLVYMTGILPIKKYGVHSALNMFSEYSMTEPKALAEYVGFTEAEVEELCKRFNMDILETKRWYDGYYFVNAGEIYSPKSVVDCMLNREYLSYWTNTETYEALKVYIDMNFDGLKDSIIKMLNGERLKINIRKFQNDMTTFSNKDDVLTLLVHLGYLGYFSETKEVFIPNEEIRDEYITAIEDIDWSEVINSIQQSEELLKALWNGNEEKVAESVDTVHMDTSSILTYNHENDLSCTLSLAFYKARDYYILKRELPAGKGFADIVLLPRTNKNKPAAILELKWDKDADSAIKQIKEKKYVKVLEDYSGEIILCGINYDRESKKHSCKIERVNK